ncbi:MAG: CheB methylesterase domain-containing protein [Sulfurospirillum sp.]
MEIKKLILIGASTGGPGQIQKIVQSIRQKKDTAVIIAQHMQSSYLSSFASQLDRNSPISVIISKKDLTIKTDTIYVLGNNFEIKNRGRNLVFDKYHQQLSYSPNIDLLFNSVSNLQKKPNIMCIVLTGIGDDGAKGALSLAKIGAICINESESSSIVYGMPKAASELNPSAKQLGIDEICNEIRSF